MKTLNHKNPAALLMLAIAFLATSMSLNGCKKEGKSSTTTPIKTNISLKNLAKKDTAGPKLTIAAVTTKKDTAGPKIKVAVPTAITAKKDTAGPKN